MQRRRIAIALAFIGCLPTPLPLSWLHKFYLGQYLWGVVYLVLMPTGIPTVACCIEGAWYLRLSDQNFASRFPKAGALLADSDAKDSEARDGKDRDSKDKNRTVKPGGDSTSAQAAQQVAVAVRALDQLRQDGLITEYEFEQKRRRLLKEID